MMPQRDHYRRHKRRIWPWILAGLALLVLVVLGGTYFGAKQVADDLYAPTQGRDQDKEAGQRNPELGEDPISVLLVGMDSGNGRTTGEQNTDALILLTLNPKTGSAKMLSIPRDTYSEQVGTKINAAYGQGGIEATIGAVQELLNVPVDYYALVNMTGLVNIVDSLGGIQVDNPLSFSNMGYSFPQGRITLHDGQEAMAYIRMRYEDPEGDFGRARREQVVLRGILDSLRSVQSLTHLKDLSDIVRQNVRTDLQLSDMMVLAKDYRNTADAIEQGVLKGTDDMSTGTYLSIVSEEDRQEASNRLRQHLELPKASLSD